MELYSFYWFSRYSGNRLYRTLVIRMTLPLKQETILRDLESRAEQVYSTLRGRMHSSCGDQLAGSENLNRLPPLWDLPVFNQETLASFFHLEGCKKWDWREMSLATDLGWGPDARRGARSLLLTCVKRLQETLVLRYSPQSHS
jgi:hypothetical protein